MKSDFDYRIFGSRWVEWVNSDIHGIASKGSGNRLLSDIAAHSWTHVLRISRILGSYSYFFVLVTFTFMSRRDWW